VSVNKYVPHIHVLPEDDGNRQIANGFISHDDLDSRAVQVFPSVGGWAEVIDAFVDNHLPKLRRFIHRRIVLLIDFDGQYPQRFDHVRGRIPQDLVGRVFVLGTLSTPERLRRAMNQSYEAIGRDLSKDCADNTRIAWEHDLLIHNNSELERMILSLSLFSSLSREWENGL
jgi:hypothetical protein